LFWTPWLRWEDVLSIAIGKVDGYGYAIARAFDAQPRDAPSSSGDAGRIVGKRIVALKLALDSISDHA